MFENINSRYIMKTGADYALLIFCGDGFFRQGNTPHFITYQTPTSGLDYQLMLPKAWRVGPKYFQTPNLYSQSSLAPSRRTIIFDFCRGRASPGDSYHPMDLSSRVGGGGLDTCKSMPMSMESRKELLMNSRKAYTKALIDSKEGVTVLLSCSENQISKTDIPYANGVYSAGLLINAAKWAKNTPFGSTLSVVEAHQLADPTGRCKPARPMLLRVAGTSPLAGQTMPNVDASHHSSSGLNFPFAVSIGM